MSADHDSDRVFDRGTKGFLQTTGDFDIDFSRAKRAGMEVRLTRAQDPDRTWQLPARVGDVLPPLPRPVRAGADATQVVQIQDVLEEVIIPGGDADRTLPRRALAANATSEIETGDILSQLDCVPSVLVTAPREPAPIVAPAPALVSPYLVPAPTLAAPYAAPAPAFAAPRAQVTWDAFNLPNQTLELTGPQWQPPRSPPRWLLVGAVAVIPLLALVAFFALRGHGAPAERTGVTVQTRDLTPPQPEPSIPMPPPPSAALASAAPSPELASAAPSAEVADVKEPRPTSAVLRAASPLHARRGNIHPSGAARDALVFVDGASVGHGDVTVSCGPHRVSVGMGKMTRVIVPCGGTVSVR